MTDSSAADGHSPYLTSLVSGVSMIARERLRQQADEGWTPEHDDEHNQSELLEASRAYQNVVLFGAVGCHRLRHGPQPIE